MSIAFRLALARALTAILLLATPLAHSQNAASFDLPSQPLADSLRAVAAATHTNVVFDADLVAGARAPALKGMLTAEQAFEKLLARSAFRFIKVDTNTFSIRRTTGEARERQSEPVGRESGELPGPPGATSQAAGQTQEPESTPRTELSEVIVTGTHIHGAASPSPTITVSREDIDRSGYVDVGDVIRSLPENFSAGDNPQVQPNNTPVQGNGNLSGGSSPNLRGLGPTSTLTLVNGRRLGQDGTLGSVDISLIPLSAVERIDVVTDSSSAEYGSDAVAGVVNFVLRKDYQGAETSGSLGTSTDGGGYERRVNQLVGDTWDSGGALLVYEHERQDAVWSDQRDFTADAAQPSSLLPQLSRDSAYVSAHQDVTSSLEFFADGLYTSRESDDRLTYPPASGAGTLRTLADVHQYLADFGLNASLPDDWKATTYASAAAQRSFVTDYQIPPGAAQEKVYLQETYNGATRAAEASADGPIWSLGTESVRAALGGGYREESLDGIGAFPLSADRGVRYAFAELNAPLAAMAWLSGLRTLDLNVSGRYEGYTDVGGKVVPKVGLIMAPAAPVEFRTTWSEAYRAPTLDSLHDTSYVDALVLPDPLSATGSSLDLVRLGSNPQLRPETARTWTTGIDWRPESLRGGSLGVTYYDIHYTNRVESLANYGTALTDPAYAALVIRDPSAALQQDVIESATKFNNFSGQPYIPSDIAALVDARSVNIAEQHLNGIDLLGTSKHASPLGNFDTFVNGSYLQLRERVTATSPEQELAGVTFNPPRLRARAGLTWSDHGWAATGIVNWTGTSTNIYVPGTPTAGSWTSFDVQLSYVAPAGSVLAGLKASLSVQNLLDRQPPFAQYFGNPLIVGFNYDSNNFNPMGRFVSFQIGKEWFPKRSGE